MTLAKLKQLVEDALAAGARPGTPVVVNVYGQNDIVDARKDSGKDQFVLKVGFETRP